MKLIVQSQIYFEDLYYLETLYDHIKQDTASSSGPHSLFLLGQCLIEFWKYMYSFAHF